MLLMEGMAKMVVLNKDEVARVYVWSDSECFDRRVIRSEC